MGLDEVFWFLVLSSLAFTYQMQVTVSEHDDKTLPSLCGVASVESCDFLSYSIKRMVYYCYHLHAIVLVLAFK